MPPISSGYLNGPQLHLLFQHSSNFQVSHSLNIKRYLICCAGWFFLHLLEILGATGVIILETSKNFFLSLTDPTFLLHAWQLFLVFELAYSQQEEPSDAIFKVPVLPPPKTPEVILLEDFPSHVNRKKSCNTLLSSSGDITELNNGTMDQSADLFGNIDDCHSPGKEK